MEKMTFKADRTAYIVTHAWLAVIGMAGAMAVLWLLGNPHIWTGAVAGLTAISVRGAYVASEELAAEWYVDNATLFGPGQQKVPLHSVVQMRSMGSFVQIVTSDGNKYLIKYQADPTKTINAIEQASHVRQIRDRTKTP